MSDIDDKKTSENKRQLTLNEPKSQPKIDVQRNKVASNSVRASRRNTCFSHTYTHVFLHTLKKKILKFCEGPKCLLLGDEVSFYEGPKSIDQRPKCLFQKGPKCLIWAKWYSLPRDLISKSK